MMKSMMKDGDHYLVLLLYKSTLLKCAFSLSELLMSRKLEDKCPYEQIKLAVPDPALPKESSSTELEYRATTPLSARMDTS